MTPNRLTREQELLFNEIRRLEQPVDQAAARSMNMDAEDGGKAKGEDSTHGDGIFEKFKNMWSNYRKSF